MQEGCSNSHYGRFDPRRVPSPGVPIWSIMRIAERVAGNVAKQSLSAHAGSICFTETRLIGGDGSSQTSRI